MSEIGEFCDKNTPETIDLLGVKTDMEAAKLVYNTYPYWKCCDNVLYVFDNTTGMWSNNETIFYKILNSFESSIHLLTYNVKTGWKKSPKSYGNDLSLMKKVPPLVKTLCIDNDWIRNYSNSSLKKLLFKNGILDLTTGLFYTEFNPEFLFFDRIEDNYDDNLTQEELEYMNDIYQRLFVLPLGTEFSDYYLLNLARGLAGDLVKRCCFGIGSRDTGKSTIGKACMSSFGGYVGSFNAENLALRESKTDESAALRWALLLRYKRLIISQEMKKNITLDGGMLKKLSSGGDPIVARTHCKEEETFVPHFMVYGYANDINDIVPMDDAVIERLTIFSFKRQFVDNPSNILQLKKDPNLDNEIKTPLFKKVFRALFFKRYLKFIVEENKKELVPEIIKKGKEDWVGVENELDLIQKFLLEFEITESTHSFTSNQTIDTWLKTHHKGTSLKKFVNEMKNYLEKNSINDKKVYLCVKKICGKAERGWIGINML